MEGRGQTEKRESLNFADLSIEVAQGTPEEQEAFLLMLELSGGRTLRRFFGPRFQRVFGRLFKQETTLFGFPHCLVLRQRGQILGMALRWKKEVRKTQSRATALYLFPYVLPHLLLSLPLLQDMLRMGIPEEAYYVSNIAIFPPHQGKGLGGFLLDFLEEEAKRCGVKKVILDVEKENERALQFYRKQGYTVFRESRHFVRMEKGGLS